MQKYRKKQMVEVSKFESGLVKPDHIFLYFFHVIDTNFYKVGKAYSLVRRYSQIQYGMPMKLKLYDACLIHTNYISSFEKAIHILLKEYQVLGEWFEIPPEKMNDVRRMVAHGLKLRNLNPQ